MPHFTYLLTYWICICLLWRNLPKHLSYFVPRAGLPVAPYTHKCSVLSWLQKLALLIDRQWYLILMLCFPHDLMMLTCCLSTVYLLQWGQDLYPIFYPIFKLGNMFDHCLVLNFIYIVLDTVHYQVCLCKYFLTGCGLSLHCLDLVYYSSYFPHHYANYFNQIFKILEQINSPFLIS